MQDKRSADEKLPPEVEKLPAILSEKGGDKGEPVIGSARFNEVVHKSIEDAVKEFIKNNPQYEGLLIDNQLGNFLKDAALWYEGLAHAKIKISRCIARDSFVKVGLGDIFDVLVRNSVIERISDDAKDGEVF